jgi:Domain of unknown function (DUF4276)
MKMVFLVEEPSMKALLDGLLPRVDVNMHFQIIPHQGKSDLEQSIPRKLRAWREPDTCFFILRDQDQADCNQVKAKIVGLCRNTGRKNVVVRVVCRTLESWILADLKALEQAYQIPGLERHQNKERFRQPDILHNPFAELRKLVASYQKRSGARAVGLWLDLDNERSRSFRTFVRAVRSQISN